MRFLLNRFPHRSEIFSLLGVVVFICFSWTILGFLNQFSSYILHFKIAQIAEILAFMMSIALLESFLVTGFLILLSAAVPRGWLTEGFAVKGSVIVVVFTVASFFVQRSLQEFFPSTLFLLAALLIPVTSAILWIALMRVWPVTQRVMLGILDRLQIMLFLYVPLGVLSLFVLLYLYLL